VWWKEFRVVVSVRHGAVRTFHGAGKALDGAGKGAGGKVKAVCGIRQGRRHASTTIPQTLHKTGGTYPERLAPRQWKSIKSQLRSNK
jgi:hypothetical protein